MASRVVLHLGSMKSGTSYVQNVLGRNKELLAERGLLFPGPRWTAQVAAVREVADAGGPDQQPVAPDGPWRRLVEEIDAWDGTAVVSMEFLAPRSLAKIEQIRADFPDTPVEAVLTARDLGRNVPAMWLESMQTGGITPWREFVDVVRHRRLEHRAARYFWKHQDTPEIADRWAGALGAENLTIVTVPRPGAPSDLLWGRFGEALRADVDGCDLDVRSNPGIGLASALVLLRMNQAYHREHGSMPSHYDEFVKHKLAKRRLAAHAAEEPRLGFEAGWATSAAKRQIKQLRDAGHRVVGDLDELRAAPVPGVHADKVPPEQVLDAAVFALDGAVEAWADAERQLRRSRRRSGR
ncbi:hypothetical protein [Nocardioides sp. YIM 152588]|uniref:hypothetical protein n=1 Tax=Nocardioides sp. YIM 152588 TaxID=3158259 RepID=UPI0032E390BB